MFCDEHGTLDYCPECIKDETESRLAQECSDLKAEIEKLKKVVDVDLVRKDDESLEAEIARLKAEMKRAGEFGIRGKNLAQRTEGDLKRIINSSWLNLHEYSEDQERRNN